MADYTIQASDNGRVIPVNTTYSAAQILLIAPTAGFKVTIKDVGENASNYNITISRQNGELIDNIASDIVIAENGAGVSLISDGTNWFLIDSFHRVGFLQNSGRALFAGGSDGSSNTYSTIDYVTISTKSNAATFGSLTQSRDGFAAFASPIKAFFGSGTNQLENAQYSSIEYVVISTTSATSSFGSVAQARGYVAGGGNTNYGIFAGGSPTSSGSNTVTTIDYVFTSTNATSATWGQLTQSRMRSSCAGSPTRLIMSGGVSTSPYQTIDYITFSTMGNAASFGTLPDAVYEQGGASNNTRACFAGGYDGTTSGPTSAIYYVTIPTTGNASTFGNLTSSRRGVAGGASSYTTALFGGGGPSTSIDSITFSTLGNASSFGTLTVSRTQVGQCSSSHGGLNG